MLVSAEQLQWCVAIINTERKERERRKGHTVFPEIPGQNFVEMSVAIASKRSITAFIHHSHHPISTRRIFPFPFSKSEDMFRKSNIRFPLYIYVHRFVFGSLDDLIR